MDKLVELKKLLEGVHGSYPDFVEGTMMTAKRHATYADQIINYIKIHPNATTSDIIEYETEKIIGIEPIENDTEIHQSLILYNEWKDEINAYMLKNNLDFSGTTYLSKGDSTDTIIMTFCDKLQNIDKPHTVLLIKRDNNGNLVIEQKDNG